MIRLILEMPDAAYERIRCGIKFGPFGEISLADLSKNFDITVIDVTHFGDTKND
jgi:hypothetical protein